MDILPKMMMIPGLDGCRRLERARRESADNARRMRTRQSNGRKLMALMARAGGRAIQGMTLHNRA